MIINEKFVCNTNIDEDIYIKNGAMAVLSGMYRGNINLEEGSTLVLNGMHRGNVTVDCGSQFHLAGMMKGTLKVRKGGNAIINGMLKGDFKECEGDIELYGVVTAGGDIPPALIKKNGCVINGVRYSENGEGESGSVAGEIMNGENIITINGGSISIEFEDEE